jgi:hypothetical protein
VILLALILLVGVAHERVPSVGPAVAPAVAPAVVALGPTRESTPAPSPTPRPTATPAAVDFDLKYQPAACWSSDFRDADGHVTPGIPVSFTVKVKNPAKRTGSLWFAIDQTDWFDTTPTALDASWKSMTGQGTRHRIFLGRPVLKAGTSTVTFKILFATPFEPHYDLYAGIIGPGEAATVDLDALESQAESKFGDLWTSSSVC